MTRDRDILDVSKRPPGRPRRDSVWPPPPDQVLRKRADRLELAPRDPKERARWRFDRGGPARKHSASFDELYDAFQSECIGFREIAQQIGVSRERVRQLYRDFFADLFPRKNGRERQRVCTLVNRNVRLIRAQNELFANNSTFAALADRVKEFGWPMSAVPLSNISAPHLVSKTRVVVNGFRCSVHRANAAMHTGGAKRYWRFVAVDLSDGDFTLFLTSGGWFVFPHWWLRRTAGGRDRPSYIVPEEKIPGDKPRKHDFWQFHEAWQQLGPEALLW